MGAFIRYLLLNSKYNVFNIDKLGYASNLVSINNLIRQNDFIDKSRYKFLNSDLKDLNILKEIINEAKPDLIIHFAAESHVDRSIKHPNSFISNNISATINLLECATEYWKTLNYENLQIFFFTT